MNKEIQFDIREENDSIVCKVTIPAYGRLYPQKTRLRTPHIKEYLKGKGLLKDGYALTKEGYVNNRYSPPILESEWVFTKVEQEIKKPVRRKRRTKTTT